MVNAFVKFVLVAKTDVLQNQFMSILHILIQPIKRPINHGKLSQFLKLNRKIQNQSILALNHLSLPIIEIILHKNKWIIILIINLLNNYIHNLSQETRNIISNLKSSYHIIIFIEYNNIALQSNNNTNTNLKQSKKHSINLPTNKTIPLNQSLNLNSLNLKNIIFIQIVYNFKLNQITKNNTLHRNPSDQN